MPDDNIVFKGTKDGLQIFVSDDLALEEIENGLKTRLREAGNFFKGTELVVQFVGHQFLPEETSQLKTLLEEEIEAPVTIKEPLPESKRKFFLESDDFIIEGPSKFIYNTIRSGQRIVYNGSIVVIGDVNPGAELIASGNIVVVGYVRGLVHAGANGNDKAVIVATGIRALQLRIASLITRAPDNDDIEPFEQPEIAYISGSEIVIEPYSKAAYLSRHKGEI